MITNNMTHHKTWFPVIVVALTALLGLFIYSVFHERITSSTQPVSPVTAVEYQAEVHATVGTLRSALASATTDVERVTLLSTSRDELLTFLVPAEYKDAHLELVMTLSQWMVGYQGVPEKLSAAELRFQALVDQYSWIE